MDWSHAELVCEECEECIMSCEACMKDIEPGDEVLCVGRDEKRHYCRACGMKREAKK
jgi:hypothetical protein